MRRQTETDREADEQRDRDKQTDRQMDRLRVIDREFHVSVSMCICVQCGVTGDGE